jgi:hypothetical protein
LLWDRLCWRGTLVFESSGSASWVATFELTSSIERHSLSIDLLFRQRAEESDHRIRAVVALPFPPHSEGTGDTPGQLSSVSLVGLWPGQRGPVGLRVIAVGTTADSLPLVVLGRHLTGFVASILTRAAGMSPPTNGPSVRFTPA